MQPTHDLRVAPRTTLRRDERAFTMIEMMIVLFIVAIMIGLGIKSMRGSRDTGGRLEVKAVASRYADAVNRFKADHGRRVPTLGTATWPTADAKLGPQTVVTLSSGSTTKFYVQQPIPEILERPGPLNAEIVAAPASPAAEGGTLVYERTTPYQFTISAYWNGKLMCVAGDTDPGDNVC
jgi:prepilin-type N-terminal cleavage/methylation domain-containing protein